MLILPYSTALQLARPPLATYALALICVVVFYFQVSHNMTGSLIYYPETWNPLKMISSSFAHGGFIHLLGNLIFFFAFAPAIETLLGNKLRFLWVILFISIVVGISYSLSVLVGLAPPQPTLGFSGVVMGMIGLSAYLMPRAKIRVFCWFILFWKTFYIPAWIIAVAYIGLDSWEMITAENYNGINIVAHVAGGVAGYLYGFLWLKERKQETQEELATEIEEMELQKQHGRSHSMSFRGRNEQQKNQDLRAESKAESIMMSQLYKMVMTHRDSEAVLFLASHIDFMQAPTTELEPLFDRIEKWGPSRTLLCLGRLIISRLDADKRYGRGLFYIGKCVNISPQFILGDVSGTLFYARMAIESGQNKLAVCLLANPAKRYGALVNADVCNQLTTLAKSQS